ncbi:uncharacterized protein LOC127877945 [Dreissena polymorpha]|uniref:Uncharacterized protein n=1 Tax=Dreissena polymorpha TaxID=45954 RepID=A0A9D4KBG6_DREPO|nr:uncharacterized protein LOC127877945 [Dreissena polymorpha]KAH3836722.1 hypothetical protein DPMN_110096 [Dreissena polymorpha]
MAYKIPSRPFCDSHTSSVAIAMCKSHQEFLCTHCLVGGVHNTCGNLIEIRSKGPIYEDMLIDLSMLRKHAEHKLSARENVEKEIEYERENVVFQINQYLEKLNEALQTMKSETESSMEQYITKDTEFLKTEIKTLSNVLESLDDAITTLFEADAQQTTANKDEERPITHAQFQGMLVKKQQAQKMAAYMTDPDHAVLRYELVRPLQDIIIGRRKLFGKVSLNAA